MLSDGRPGVDKDGKIAFELAAAGAALGCAHCKGALGRCYVFGQGVAPTVTASPAQAYALAKRAALADGYRQIAERIQGVHIEGYDSVKNMILQRSNIRTSVDAMVRGTNVLDTTFKEGLCEVELEVVIAYSQLIN